MTLRDKTFVLTGATGGIGQAIARRLVKAGAKLILVGRSASALNTLIESLDKVFHGSTFLVADIASQEGREIIRTALLDLKTPLDGLINCAGINHFSFLSVVPDLYDTHSYLVH